MFKKREEVKKVKNEERGGALQIIAGMLWFRWLMRLIVLLIAYQLLIFPLVNHYYKDALPSLKDEFLTLFTLIKAIFFIL